MPTRSTKAAKPAPVRKKAAAPRTTGTTKTSAAAASRSTASGTRSTAKKVADAAKSAGASVKKHVGDVLGISRARVPASVPRATKDRGGRPKGIELSSRTRARMTPRPARVKM